MRAFERLDLYIIGDRLHTDRKIQKKTQLRLKEKEQIVRTFEPSKRIVYGVKSCRKSIEPGPNAPLLKRIVKNPQPLELGYMVRSKIERAKPQQRLVYQKNTIIRDYFQSDKKIKKMRPMDLYEKAKTPNIPSIDDWIQQVKKR